uniref:Apolipoprotein F n=1 Tax=Latimeria chalumnae TaxID=7897 RepID=H3A8Q3_LATCH
MTNSNISCNDLADRALLDNIRFLPLARDFCAVALIFTMEQLGCTEDLKTPLYQLYDDLGVSGTIDTLLKIRELMEKAPNGTNSLERDTVKSDNVKALLYNIRQITLQSQALASHDFVSSNQPPEHCHGFVQITGSSLFGERHSMHEVLLDAMSKCRDLGFTCAGVTSSGNGSFEVIYREGSYCYPNQEALVWIYDCDDLVFGKGHHITKRQSDCVDQDEQKVYDIVQWIPMVSLFYNLGTSIYYGAKGCSDVAESRAIDMAVDVGTDAVIALTGGAASVAGYGVKAGIKLGAKAGLKAATQAVKTSKDAIVSTAKKIQTSVKEGVDSSA